MSVRRGLREGAPDFVPDGVSAGVADSGIDCSKIELVAHGVRRGDREIACVNDTVRVAVQLGDEEIERVGRAVAVAVGDCLSDATG
jgi:hypothetical protein